MKKSRGRSRSVTHSEHDVRSPVHQSHALAWNPKGFGLVGEETAVGRNLRERRRCECGAVDLEHNLDQTLQPGLWLNGGGEGTSRGNSTPFHLDYLVPQIAGRRHPVESLDCGRKLLDVRHHRVTDRVQDRRNLLLVQAFQAPAAHVHKLITGSGYK